jgi:hypothetical protein
MTTRSSIADLVIQKWNVSPAVSYVLFDVTMSTARASARCAVRRGVFVAKHVSDDSENKTAMVSIRLSTEELAAVRSRAENVGESISTFGRNLLLSGELQVGKELPRSQSFSGYAVGGNMALEWDGQEIVSKSTEPVSMVQKPIGHPFSGL